MRAPTLRLAIAMACLLPVAGGAQSPGDWPSHHRDLAGTRFSPLKQITPANVASLAVAWTFDTGAKGVGSTPLVVGGVMYLTAGMDVLALAPETGVQVWKYTAAATVSRRGVAYWPGDAKTPARIIVGAGDKMLALDAKSGTPVAGFGESGFVDLRTGIKGDIDGNIGMFSPPAIYKDIIVSGGNNGEQAPSYGLYGDIRGWDVRTGALLWSFHTVPRAGEPGVETWEGDSWKNRSGTNMWSFFTIDAERGLVFAPIGSPTSDYYGGDRTGAGLDGNSIVALDAVTGTLKWHHQLVHHDLWDFDLPAAPTLVDITRNGKTIPAVAVLTKMTTVFFFDRVTGEPIYGMEERPAPKSTVPGESSWPTQPWPLKPPPLGRTDFDPGKDFYAPTPEHLAYCTDLWEANHMFTYGPFTPPSVEATMLTFPSTIGGGNWNGFVYDAGQGLLITNIMNLGQVARMEQRADRQTGKPTYVRVSPWGGPVGRFWNPDTKVPCSPPPFGELVAINVNTGEIAWRSTLGLIESLKAKGIPDTGTVNLGGGIGTAGGVIFIGATNDHRFRAFDLKSGKKLWEVELDASAHGVPMTYQGKDGRQYVAVAAGGGSYLASPSGSKVVAYALPKKAGAPQAPTAGPVTVAKNVKVSFPDGPGKTAFVDSCGSCHELSASVVKRHTAKEWQDVMVAMKSRGMTLPEKDLKDVTGYLVRFFGQIAINSASADEIQRVLGITAEQATAIVAYRSAHGPLKSIDDLKAVPGLDPAGIEKEKAAVVFGGR